MPWDQLIQIALLGTERAAPAPALLSELAARGVDMSASPEQIILEGAVIWRQISRVGYQPALYSPPLPAAFDAAVERPCPPPAARTLGRILEGSYEQALEEWLMLLGRANYHLPAECLPLLFDRCLQQPALWPQVKAVMGPRGAWLAPQNPDWQVFFGIPDISVWETGSSRDHKRAVLIFLRQNDPALARQLLAATWRNENPGDRIAFLKTLETGLSSDDESFLESCLDDSRKEIRQTAGQLLAWLPGSGLSKLLWEYGKSWLDISSGAKIKIKIPARLPDALLRAGIGPENGKGIDWLQQLLARVPPDRWASQFGMPPAAFYPQLSPDLAEAIEEAAWRQRDTHWATAICDYWLKENSPSFKMSISKSRILSLVSHADFSRFAFEAVKESGTPLPERSALFVLLTQPGRCWDDQLTASVITGFQQVIAASKSYGWHLWHYKQLLLSASYACRPALYDSLQKGWPFSSPVWYNWQAEVEQMLRIVDFRRRMGEDLGAVGFLDF